MLGRLWGNGDNLRAEFGELMEASLERPELPTAVGVRLTVVEDQNDRPGSEEGPSGRRIAALIGKREVAPRCRLSAHQRRSQRHQAAAR